MAVSEAPTATAAVDVVCVLNEALAQVFERARPIKASVMTESKAMEHPLETGASIVDHRVIMATAIELSMVLSSDDYPSVYNQIKDLFLRGELLTVQTRVGSYPSMFIEKIPHEETPDMLDGAMLALSLREAQFVTPQFSTLKVATPRDSNTTPRGEQQPQATPPQRGGSILSRVFS
jgi:hypothetical protein